MIKSIILAATILATANPGQNPMDSNPYSSYNELYMGEIVNRVGTREFYLVVRDERSFETELVQILPDGSLWSYESDVPFLTRSQYTHVSDFNFHR